MEVGEQRSGSVCAFCGHGMDVFKPHVGFAAPYASICFGLHNNEVVPILFLQSAFLELQEKRSLA